MIQAHSLGNLPVIYCAPQVGEMFEVRASSASSGGGRGPELAQLLCDEGAALYAQRRVDAAERRYARALRADPDHVASLCGLAWLLKNEKNDVITARVRPALTAAVHGQLCGFRLSVGGNRCLLFAVLSAYLLPDRCISSSAT